MIVVCGVHHRFVFSFCVGAGQHGNHVVRLERSDLAHHVCIQLGLQRNRLEIARACIGHQFVEVEIRIAVQIRRDIELNPSRDF